jgi:hypothetical protein
MNAPHPTSRYLRNEDFLCGIALILFAAFIYYVARNYPVGTADSMGPGYFPRGLCYVVAILGLALAGSGLLRVEQAGPSEERLRLRPLIAVSAAFIVFGLTLSTIGLLPAIGLLILICCLAIPKRRFWEVVAIVIVMEGMTLAMWNLVQISVPLVGKF